MKDHRMKRSITFIIAIIFLVLWHIQELSSIELSEKERERFFGYDALQKWI